MRLAPILPLLFCLSCFNTYKQATVDVGADLATGVYPYVGLSLPLGGAWVSIGAWTGWSYEAWSRYFGPYVTVGWSWSLFKERK